MSRQVLSRVLLVAGLCGMAAWSLLTLWPQQPVAFSYAPEAQEYLERAQQGIYQERFLLDTATAQQLESIPGIGPVLAQRILEYLEQHGPIREYSELQKIKGIGKKLSETIAQYTKLS